MCLPACSRQGIMILRYWENNKIMIEKKQTNKKQNPDPYKAINSDGNLAQQSFEAFPFGNRRGDIKIKTAAWWHSGSWTSMCTLICMDNVQLCKNYSGLAPESPPDNRRECLGHERPWVTRSRLTSRGLLQSPSGGFIIMERVLRSVWDILAHFPLIWLF